MSEAPMTPLFEDVSNLDGVLGADASGEQARALIAYFEQNRIRALALLASALPMEERQLVGRLTEGLAAAQRIVKHVWEGAHSAPLSLQ